MHHPWSPFDSRIHHRKCLPGLGPQLRLRDYASVHLPILFLFVTSGPGDRFVACATLAAVDRAPDTALMVGSHSHFLSSPSTQMAAACMSVTVLNHKASSLLVPSSGLGVCISLCDQWQPFTVEYVLLTAVPMGHPAQSIPQDSRKPWGVIRGR